MIPCFEPCCYALRTLWIVFQPDDDLLPLQSEFHINNPPALTETQQRRVMICQRFRPGIIEHLDPRRDCHSRFRPLHFAKNLETTRLLRQRESQNDWPCWQVMALSGNAMDEEKQQCLSVGIDGCLTRPMKMKEVQSIVAETPRRR